jgi:hypothetical protein
MSGKRRREDRINSAWTLIAAAKQEQTGNLGLVDAIATLRGYGIDDFTGLFLPGAHLGAVDFAGAKLQGATLLKSNLAGADLSDANLWRADLLVQCPELCGRGGVDRGGYCVAGRREAGASGAGVAKLGLGNQGDRGNQGDWANRGNLGAAWA